MKTESLELYQQLTCFSEHFERKNLKHHNSLFSIIHN